MIKIILKAFFVNTCLLGLVSLFYNAPLFGSTFFPREFPLEVKDAPMIVRGRVGMSYSDFGKDSEGTKKIYTFTELQISETFKGPSTTPSIIIREVGGEKDGLGLQVPGASQYDRGEDVVVFLGERNSDGSFDVFGMMMGKYNLLTDPKGEEYLVGPGLASQPIHAHIDQESDSKQNNLANPKKWTLDALRQLIQAQAEENAQGNSKQNRAISQEQPTPSPSTSQSPPSSSAFGLQPQSIEEPNPSSPAASLYTIVGVIALGASGIIAVLFRRKM